MFSNQMKFSFFSPQIFSSSHHSNFSKAIIYMHSRFLLFHRLNIHHDRVEKVCWIVFAHSINTHTNECYCLLPLMANACSIKIRFIQSRCIVHSCEYRNKLEGGAIDSVIDLSAKWAEAIFFICFRTIFFTKLHFCFYAVSFA